MTASASDEWQYPWVTGTATVVLTVNSEVVTSKVTATASASPTTVANKGSIVLTATAVDALGHTGLAWSWSDNGAGGTFSPSATVQNPTYIAAANTTGSARKISLTVSAIDEWQYPWITGTATVVVTENP